MIQLGISIAILSNQMTEDRLVRVEQAVENMADGINEFTKAIGELLKDNAVRDERDRHQTAEFKKLSIDMAETNKKLTEFVESYREHDKPVIETSRKWQAATFWGMTRVILPVVIVAVLMSAGINIYGDKTPIKQESIKVK